MSSKAMPSSSLLSGVIQILVSIVLIALAIPTTYYAAWGLGTTTHEVHLLWNEYIKYPISGVKEEHFRMVMGRYG